MILKLLEAASWRKYSRYTKKAKTCMVEDHLQVCFVGEDETDTGGLDLLKDIFSMFWEKAFKTYFTGENVFVPFLPVVRLHEANRIYPLLGRILSHSTALLQTIPVHFCRSTLLTLLHSPLEANEECLSRGFHENSRLSCATRQVA